MSMAMGRDVFAAFYRLAEYKLGRGLSAYINMDSLPTGFNYPLGKEELAQIEKQVMEDINMLLAPAEELSAKLLDSCKESGIFYRDPQRGWGIKLDENLSEDQEKMLAELQQMIDEIPTFLNNIPFRSPEDRA